MDGSIDPFDLVVAHNDARDDASWLWEIMPLVKDDKLMEYAQDWAEYMAETGRMHHSSMRDIMALGFKLVGENIAWGQKDVEAVMRTWLNSPGHKANMLSTKFSSIGCGVAESDRGIMYWCACFGVPTKGKIGIYGPCPPE